jgi:hypothetical protein
MTPSSAICFAWVLVMSNTATSSSAISYLVPAHTTVETNGQSQPFDLGPLTGRMVLVVLRIEDMIEQESLHVSIWGSADGQDWGTEALFWFPQKFYRGVTPAAVDLHQRSGVKFLQARWEVDRWGRGIPRPCFTFAVEVQEAGV